MVDRLSELIEENNRRHQEQEDRFMSGAVETESPIGQQGGIASTTASSSAAIPPSGSVGSTTSTAVVPPAGASGSTSTGTSAAGASSSPTPGGSAGSTTSTTPPVTPPPSDVNVDNVVAGISSAYGINPAELQAKAPPPKPKAPTPPPASKEGKGGGEKDIMAVFWGMILDFYGWCIDKAVDIPLDFLKWVLYAQPEQAEVKRGASVLDMANDEKKNFFKNIEETNKEAQKGFDEIDKNIRLLASGESASWRELALLNAGRLNEIKDYTTNVLLPSFRAFNADPNDPEANAYKNFKKLPDILDKSTKKIKMIGSFGYSLAALKVLSNEDGSFMPAGFTDKYKELQKKLKSRTVDFVAIERLADELIAIVPDNETFKVVRENLTQIKQKSTASDKDGVVESVKNINKEVTDEGSIAKYKKHIITTNACVYIGKILENIDKIYENCGTDVDKRNETIKNYCEHIDNAIKNVSETATDVDESIRRGGSASKSGRKKIKDALDSIDSFDFDGRNIGAHASPTRRTQNIYSNKNAIYDYMVGRV